MSPISLRRYRAERLLRREFDALRAQVLASVGARLGASGARLDPADLDACYAQAWQGLYTELLAGEEISNVAGWLVVVTSRRAIDEHRARMRERHRDLEHEGRAALWERPQEHDLAGELDDRLRIRQLFEGLRGRLSAREREAAVLCYLQGLSRSQAAALMGVSEARMRKLMEGRGAGRPGVARKVGMLVEAIGSGGWCEEQGSLMRALAYGILDPDGERFRLALIHVSNCPGCRAYVVSLRGMAATLPPVLLPSGMGAAAVALAGGGANAGGGTVAGVGSMSAGGAGGGWALATGPLGAKLAVGCALALGLGAGCAALGVDLKLPSASRKRSPPNLGPPVLPGEWGPGYRMTVGQRGSRSSAPAGRARQRSASPVPLRAGGAEREFGPQPRGPALAAPSRGRAAGRGPSPMPLSAAADREFAPG
jgi:RNA polymerase sigma factor (sigma-70 family)